MTARLDSQIISGFPEILSEFWEKTFENSVAGQSGWFQSKRISRPM
jgi:hypothetical protein